MDAPSRPRVDAAWLPVAGWLVAVVVASAVDPSAIVGAGAGAGAASAPLGVHVTVWLHLGAYAVLAWLLDRAVGGDEFRAALLAVVAAAVVGLGVEAMQAAIPTRTASAGDALANLVGAGVGVGCRRLVAAFHRSDARDR